MEEIMSTFIVGRSSHKETEFIAAFQAAKPGDTLQLMPGNYFKKADLQYFNINQNISITGLGQNKEEVVLNCNLNIGNQAVVLLKNLTIHFSNLADNAVAIYDQARLYGQAITIHRDSPDNWDAVYCQNSGISLTDSQIKTSTQTRAVGLSLENSQFYAENTMIDWLFQKNSQAYLKHATIKQLLSLRHHSQTYFSDLIIDSASRKNIALKSYSSLTGIKLQFTTPKPQINICESQLTVKDTSPKVDDIIFKFDAASKVHVSGRIPKNHLFRK